MSAANVQKFQFAGNQISYRRFGNGPAVLLTFHGFGQSSEVFYPLENTLGEQFTIFAIDLFFHGNSIYTGSQLLTKSGWQQLISVFLQVHTIGRFSLMGFSLGGRFALSTVEGFADRIDQLILIAPDGITYTFWYRLATGSQIGRSLFRYGLRHLPLLNRFGHALTQLGLLNRTIMRFAEISLSTLQQRQLVYQSWTQFRLIRPDLNTIAKSLNDNAVQVYFFTGAFDRIVPGDYMVPLTKQLRKFTLTILKTGHNRLIELAAEQLKRD